MLSVLLTETFNQRDHKQPNLTDTSPYSGLIAVVGSIAVVACAGCPMHPCMLTKHIKRAPKAINRQRWVRMLIL